MSSKPAKKTLVEQDLDSIFDLEGPSLHQALTKIDAERALDSVKKKRKEISQDSDIEADYQVARENIRDVIEQTMDSLGTLRQVAEVQQGDKDFTALAQLTRVFVDANKELLKIQKELVEIEKIKTAEHVTKGGPKQTITADKAVFVGTTNELLRMTQKDE